MTHLKNLFVIGYPSHLGGADTELWHVLRLWRRFGLDVRLIPTWRASGEIRGRCDALDIETVQVKGPDDLGEVPDLAGSTVISFCNGEFLKSADVFRSLGCRVIWAGCMTWMFPAERKHYAEYGPFDAYVFQSEFQKSKLLPQLAEFNVGDERCFHIPGAIDADQFPFQPLAHQPNSDFVVGRLARPDLDKWSSNTWAIYQAIPYARRRARLMGWNDRLAGKLGQPPEWAEVLSPCAEPADQFLATLHCLLAVSGGAQENWPRVGLEAMAAGVPLVVQNEWGWREMIDHGRTGYLASTDAELAYYSARLAMDEDHRMAIISNARRALVAQLAPPNELWSRWTRLFESIASLPKKSLSPASSQGRLDTAAVP